MKACRGGLREIEKAEAAREHGCLRPDPHCGSTLPDEGRVLGIADLFKPFG